MANIEVYISVIRHYNIRVIRGACLILAMVIPATASCTWELLTADCRNWYGMKATLGLDAQAIRYDAIGYDAIGQRTADQGNIEQVACDQLPCYIHVATLVSLGWAPSTSDLFMQTRNHLHRQLGYIV